MSKVTIQDIADELGVSRNTVSKAINNTGNLSDAMRERVLQKVVEMGYKHFSYAAEQAGLEAAQKESPGGTIALLTTAFFERSHHFAVLMLDCFKQELLQLGYTLTAHYVSPEDLRNGALPASFDPQQNKGVLCIEMFDYDYCRMICDLNLPVLFVDGPNKRTDLNLPADQLYMDNTTGITQLVNQMLQKGRQNIGFIGDYEHCQSFFERYTAFRTAMLLAGARVMEDFCIKDNGKNIEPRLRALPTLPDLFICANDFVAWDALQVLHKMGKSVPEDVLLCGFDDSPESRFMNPALTTVHIHTQIMARTAAELLIGRVKDPAMPYRTVYTQTDLLCRESTKI